MKAHVYEWIQDGRENVDNVVGAEESRQLFTGVTVQQSDWVEMLDEASGKAFWYNSKSRESTWFNPFIPVEYLHEYYPSVSEDNFTTQPDIQASWKKYFDEGAQADYWYNEKTGESSWENPEKSSNIWEEHFDLATHLPFWYNVVTGESTWKNPY